MEAELAAAGGPPPVPDPASSDDEGRWPGILLPLSVIGGAQRPLVPLSGPDSTPLAAPQQEEGALAAVKALLKAAWR